MAFKRKNVRRMRKLPKRKLNRNRRVSVRAVVRKEMNRLAVKPEVKRQDYTYATQDAVLGQCIGNANGYYAADITPPIAAGTGPNQRIGNRVSIKSAYMTIQLRQMSGCAHPTKLKFYLFYDPTSNTDAASSIVDDLFNYNEYIQAGTTIYDYNSTRNLDYITDMKLLRTWTSFIRSDSVSSQINLKTFSIGFKWKKPINITWNSTGSANNAVGRFYLIVFSDSGNASTTTASTLINAPVTAINTGTFFNYSMKWYYTDS